MSACSGGRAGSGECRCGHLRRPGVAEVMLRLVVSLPALSLIFYGAMLALAAVKLGPHTINSISASTPSTRS